VTVLSDTAVKVLVTTKATSGSHYPFSGITQRSVTVSLVIRSHSQPNGKRLIYLVNWYRMYLQICHRKIITVSKVLHDVGNWRLRQMQ
jgi:hypothetical protein